MRHLASPTEIFVVASWYRSRMFCPLLRCVLIIVVRASRWLGSVSAVNGFFTEHLAGGHEPMGKTNQHCLLPPAFSPATTRLPHPQFHHKHKFYAVMRNMHIHSSAVSSQAAHALCLHRGHAQQIL